MAKGLQGFEREKAEEYAQVWLPPIHYTLFCCPFRFMIFASLLVERPTISPDFPVLVKTLQIFKLIPLADMTYVSRPEIRRSTSTLLKTRHPCSDYWGESHTTGSPKWASSSTLAAGHSDIVQYISCSNIEWNPLSSFYLHAIHVSTLK